MLRAINVIAVGTLLLVPSSGLFGQGEPIKPKASAVRQLTVTNPGGEPKVRVVVVGGEAPASKRKAGLLELYEKIKPGMTRDQVEAVLGKPVGKDLKQPSGDLQAHYLSDEYRERVLDMQASPFLPTGIYVIYMDGKLTKRAYNSQWLTQTAWGKAVDGVEYGFEFKEHKRHYKVGDQVTFTLKARNTTDKAVTFDQVQISGGLSCTYGALNAFGATMPRVDDATGKATKVSPAVVGGIAPPVAIRKVQLAAKEMVTLGQVAYTIGPTSASPRIEAGPGIYLVRFDTVCWLPGHQRPTGMMEIVVLPKD